MCEKESTCECKCKFKLVACVFGSTFQERYEELRMKESMAEKKKRLGEVKITYTRIGVN